MLQNLEGISFDEVIDENGLSYAAFRKSLTPHYSRVLFDIFKGYLFIFILSGLIIYAENYYPRYGWIIIPAGSILLGYTAAYLALFIHEAGHFNIHPDKNINDRLSTVFLCLTFGLSLKSYRKIHWQHHLHLGTPLDTENSYFNGLTKLFLAETLTGIHLLKTIRKKETATFLNKDQLYNSRLMLIAGILLHTFILGTAALTGNPAFIIVWLLAWGIFFPFFATIRQISEHRDELANYKTDFHKIPHGKISRLFFHNLLSSSFGAAGFTRHLIHHWDPQISYTRLKDIEIFLARSKKTAHIISKSKTTYAKVLKKLVLHP